MKFFSRTEQPEFIRAYVENTRRNPIKNTPYESIDFVALDTETTGLHPNSDRILSVAAFKMNNGKIEVKQAGRWIIYQPLAEAPNKASEIHGILPSETEAGVPEEKALRELIPLLSGAVVVGHCIQFDAQILDAAFRRHFKTRFLNTMVDTGKMAMLELIPFHQVGYAGQSTPSLEDICSHLNLPIWDRHTAEGDAFIAAQVFLLLAGRLRKRSRKPVRLREFPTFRL